jgi:hypothetical protein
MMRFTFSAEDRQSFAASFLSGQPLASTGLAAACRTPEASNRAVAALKKGICMQGMRSGRIYRISTAI